MGNEMITLIIDAKNLASAQLKALQKDLRGVDEGVGRTDAAMNRAGMVAKGVLAVGFAAAAYQAAKFVGDSVAAFREEEIGIVRLGASLRANVKDWDGNTDAIERTVKAKMASGFSDDAIRESLSRLVPVTRNVGEAFRLQAAAMDLARFKGISLEDASVALVKVEGGQYRALKELGIVLKAGATQTEALAAVQRVAGGQMAAYMDTAAGKAEILSNRLADMQEELGGRLTPAIEGVTEALLDLTGGMEQVHAVDWGEFTGWGVMDALTLDILNLDRKTQVWKDNTTAAAGAAAMAWDTGSERIGGSLQSVVADLEATGPKAYTASLATMEQVEKGIHAGAAGIASAWRDAMSERNREADAADQIIVNKAEIRTQKLILADKHATRAQKAEARIRLRALRADNEALEREMELLKNKGYVYGRGFTLGFIRGLVKDTDSLRANARHLSHVVRQYLQVRSPSELGPFSEMGGPEGWGAKFSGLYAKGLGGGAGAVGSAASGIAGAVAMPSGARGGLAPAGAVAGGGAAGGVHLHVHSAFPPTPQQIREWASLLDAEFIRRGPRYSPFGS